MKLIMSAFVRLCRFAVPVPISISRAAVRAAIFAACAVPIPSARLTGSANRRTGTRTRPLLSRLGGITAPSSRSGSQANKNAISRAAIQSLPYAETENQKSKIPKPKSESENARLSRVRVRVCACAREGSLSFSGIRDFEFCFSFSFSFIFVRLCVR